MSCQHGNHPDGCDLCDELNALHREIAELQRRAERAEASATAWNEAASLMKLRATQAESALSAAKEDAERYRWLRKKERLYREEIEPVIMVDGDMMAGEKLDAAIDAARSGASHQRKAGG